MIHWCSSNSYKPRCYYFIEISPRKYLFNFTFFMKIAKKKKHILYKFNKKWNFLIFIISNALILTLSGLMSWSRTNISNFAKWLTGNPLSLAKESLNWRRINQCCQYTTETAGTILRPP